jgi:sugar/nucleoside kinase (ribokinase family)
LSGRQSARTLAEQLTVVLVTFRHTYATLRVETGANMALIAAAMGNSVEMVSKVYSHPGAESIRDLNRNN